MLNSKAYWITPEGEILDFGLQTHIGFIIKQPEIFNMTKQEIVSTYHRYDELPGIEGKARHEIILKLITRGFIRIRLYQSHWSISADSCDDKNQNGITKMLG